MVFPKWMSHNQGFFTSAFVSLVLLLAMLSCHLTPEEKKEVVAHVGEVATAVVTGGSIPWETAGLVLGSLISTGLVIDNRRKDTIIQVVKGINAKVTKELVRGNGQSSDPSPPSES